MPIHTARNTTVGAISAETLAYTVGKDTELDQALVEADCIGSAAHVTMLSRIPIKPRLFTPAQKDRVILELVRIMRQARRGQFAITLDDQDVHLAVERALTEQLGEAGKKIHTARSRNDQVAVDLRLYGKTQLLGVLKDTLALAETLFGMAETHWLVPMVGRTHMQPAMPSSVGLWAGSYAEELMDDMGLIRQAYHWNDQCPLGSAASYGVPLPIDRQLTADLLGFSRPHHNVLAAGNARGKIESVILGALSQIMLTISRLAQDLMLYTMPEFNYFILPPDMCTGSSIMPQKSNPDILELARAKSAQVMADAFSVMHIIRGLPGGYNRDLQEAKEPFMRGLHLTRSTLRVLDPLIKRTRVNESALLAGFTPAVFATDAALELVGKGVPFRDAYRHVKEHLANLDTRDPHQAVTAKNHLGAPAGLDFKAAQKQVRDEQRFIDAERARFHQAVSRLLKTQYPLRG